jgi:hypothetical protein
MNDSEYERILDRRVQARLKVDRAYLNAENAEEQSQREYEIEQQEAERLDHGDCLWFHGCTNPATHLEPHPILGGVPICDRCAAKVAALS